MEQKLSDTLVKAIDRSNPFMQNLQLASRFNKLIDESGADLEDNKEVTITENGEIEITPSEGKDGMKKVTATVNVAGADLEDNKEATIDVSAYTEPVEITPAEGKDGMKKVTVSLSNMPAGANMLYAWRVTGYGTYYRYISAGVAPADETEALNTKKIGGNLLQGTSVIESLIVEGIDTYTYVSDTEFTISFEDGGDPVTETYTRDSTKDLTLWQLSE